jgi:hypothetical protein
MSQNIKNPRRPAEHLSNCQFHLDNVKGWIRSGPEASHDQLFVAKMKAESLVEAAQWLLTSIEKGFSSEADNAAGGNFFRRGSNKSRARG